MIEGKLRAIEALEREGYRQCRTGSTWVDYLNDTARRIVTLEHGAAVIITSQADLPTFLASGYSADQVEAAVVKVRAAIDDRKNGWGKAGSEAGHQALNMLLRALYAPPPDTNEEVSP